MVSPAKLFRSWREQQKAQRVRAVAGRILAVMQGRQASAEAPLFFSTELLAALLGADRSDTWGGLRKLEGDCLISRDEMTGRYSLTQRPSATR
jgi:DNA-binding IclR family transcriptional regulator